MSQSLTFAQAKSRFEILEVRGTTIADLIQESVDRAYSQGRWRGMVATEKLESSDYVKDADLDQYYYDVDLSEYNGLVGMRTDHKGWPLIDQTILYRDGISGGSRCVVDLGETDVEGTTVHRYRLPLWVNSVPGYAVYALFKKISPTLTDTDIVPIKSVGALKRAILACGYEAVNDDDRSEFQWKKFEEEMEKEQRQFEGPQQRHIGVHHAMLRRPIQRR